MPLDLKSDTGFVRPAFSDAIDLDAHRRAVPDHGTVKGMFFRALLDMVPREKRSSARRYVPFASYPMLEYMELLLKTAEQLHAHRPLREGLRRIGHAGYPTFADSLIGRVIMGVLGGDLDGVFERAPRAYSVSVEPVELTSLQMGAAHWRLGFDQVPNFVDSYHVGVIEGAILHHGKTPDVRVRLLNIDRAVFDVRWG